MLMMNKTETMRLAAEAATSALGMCAAAADVTVHSFCEKGDLPCYAKVASTAALGAAGVLLVRAVARRLRLVLRILCALASGLHKISTLLKPAWQREHYDTIGELQAAVRSRGGFDGLDVAFFVDCSGSTYFKNEELHVAGADNKFVKVFRALSEVLKVLKPNGKYRLYGFHDRVFDLFDVVRSCSAVADAVPPKSTTLDAATGLPREQEYSMDEVLACYGAMCAMIKADQLALGRTRMDAIVEAVEARARAGAHSFAVVLCDGQTDDEHALKAALCRASRRVRASFCFVGISFKDEAYGFWGMMRSLDDLSLYYKYWMGGRDVSQFVAVQDFMARGEMKERHMALAVVAEVVGQYFSAARRLA